MPDISRELGTARFSAAEVDRFREYLMKGGFVWLDDSWGSYAWAMIVGELRACCPRASSRSSTSRTTTRSCTRSTTSGRFPRSRRSTLGRNRGDTSERGRDSAVVYFKGIQDKRGLLLVLISHNTDIADTWEREGEFPQYFDLFSPRGYAIGVNIVLYAMTH